MSRDAAILIAEDDAGHFALVRKNLWRTCFLRNITHFHSGEDLLRFLFQEVCSNQKDIVRNYLILMDIRLPGKSGIDVLQIIKEDPHLRMIPVFMLTTSCDASDIQRSYDLGCCAYICKPREYKNFMETVEFLGQILSMPECLRPPFGRPLSAQVG